MPPVRAGDDTDEAIVARVRAGDVDAFEELVSRHRTHVFAIVARRIPSDQVADVAHEVFVSAYLSLDRYAPTAPWQRWLTRIALRTCLDHWRREYRRRGRSDVSLEDAGGADALAAPSGASPASREQDRDELAWLLGHLPPDDRQVLTLVHFEGMAVRDAADVLGWSPAKVKVRAHRARRRLRELLAHRRPETERTP